MRFIGKRLTAGALAVFMLAAIALPVSASPQGSTPEGTLLPEVKEITKIDFNQANGLEEESLNGWKVLAGAGTVDLVEDQEEKVLKLSRTSGGNETIAVLLLIQGRI